MACAQYWCLRQRKQVILTQTINMNVLLIIYFYSTQTQIDIMNFNPEEQTDNFEIDYFIYFIQLFVWAGVV